MSVNQISVKIQLKMENGRATIILSTEDADVKARMELDLEQATLLADSLLRAIEVAESHI